MTCVGEKASVVQTVNVITEGASGAVSVGAAVGSGGDSVPVGMAGPLVGPEGGMSHPASRTRDIPHSKATAMASQSRLQSRITVTAGLRWRSMLATSVAPGVGTG